MHESLDTRELHRLHDHAHARAEALRRAARDDFWRGADALMGGAAARALRATERLAQRMQRLGRPRAVAVTAAEQPVVSAG